MVGDNDDAAIEQWINEMLTPSPTQFNLTNGEVAALAAEVVVGEPIPLLFSLTPPPPPLPPPIFENRPPTPLDPMPTSAIACKFESISEPENGVRANHPVPPPPTAGAAECALRIAAINIDAAGAQQTLNELCQQHQQHQQQQQQRGQELVQWCPICNAPGFDDDSMTKHMLTHVGETTRPIVLPSSDDENDDNNCCDAEVAAITGFDPQQNGENAIFYFSFHPHFIKLI